MMGRIWTAYRVELSKAARSRCAWLLPLLVVAAVCLTPVVQPLARDGAADYGFIAYATRVALNIIGLIVLLAFSASTISSELASGTIRTTLLRPVQRHEFVAAKLMLVFTCAAIIAGVAALAVWILAASLGDLTGVSYGGEALYSNLAMLRAYLLGMVLAVFPLSAAGAYGVMISSLTRSPGAAVGVTVGLWLALDIAKYPLRIAPFLFSSWVETPWTVFVRRADGLDPAWLPDAATVVLVSVAWTVAFALVAAYATSRRNFQA